MSDCAKKKKGKTSGKMTSPILERVFPRIPAVIAFGDPMLETLTQIKGNSIMVKHNIRYNGKSELPLEETELLLRDLPPELIPTSFWIIFGICTAF